jgi:hypothetical protein
MDFQFCIDYYFKIALVGMRRVFVKLQEAQIRMDLSSYLARGLFPDLSHRQLHFSPSFLYWNLSCNPYFHRVSLTCLELYHLLTLLGHFTGLDYLFVHNR